MNFEIDDGGRSKHYADKSHHGDCAIRACAIATGIDYRKTLIELSRIGIEEGDLANGDSVYPKFLARHGFKKMPVPKNAKGRKVPIRSFAKTAPAGRIVALTRRHLVAIVDNVQRDTWLDERCVNTWYHKE